MKKILIAIIILVSASQAFASGPPGVTKAYVDTQAAITTEASLSGLSTELMTGYPEGAQAESDNLNYLTVGIDPQFNRTNWYSTAQSWSAGQTGVADGVKWDPDTSHVTTGALSSEIAIVEGGATDYITRQTGSFITDGFGVGMTLDLSGTALNNTTTTNRWLVSKVETLKLTLTPTTDDVAGETLIAGAVTILGNWPTMYQYDGTSLVKGKNIMGVLSLSDINMAGGTIELPNGNADVALATAGQIHLNTTDEQLSFHSAADGEISGEVAITSIPIKPNSFDPKAVCDGAVDTLFIAKIGDDAPEGIIIDEWWISFTQDPTTELDADLCYADNYTARANEVVIDALDTTSGTATEDTDANINSGNAIPNGKVVYIKINTAYTATGEQVAFQYWYHAEED